MRKPLVYTRVIIFHQLADDKLKLFIFMRVAVKSVGQTISLNLRQGIAQLKRVCARCCVCSVVAVEITEAEKLNGLAIRFQESLTVTRPESLSECV